MPNKYTDRMRGGETRAPRKPLNEIGWSWFGSFIGIYLVAVTSRLIPIDLMDKIFLIGSFGATAVLIYGTPQAEFSQPRNVLGGHVLSALVGVTLYKFVPLDVALLSALAVSLSIVAMHLSCTLHPPGGATALIAIIGSSQVHSLGYLFVLLPIAIGAMEMLLVALVINNISISSNRHYPKYWL